MFNSVSAWYTIKALKTCIILSEKRTTYSNPLENLSTIKNKTNTYFIPV